MAGEQIPLAFDGTAALQLLDQLEQRMSRLGQFGANLPIGAQGGNGGGGSGGAQGGASGAGAGSSGPASSAESKGGGWLGSVGNVLSSFNGAVANQNTMAVGDGLLGGANEYAAVKGTFAAGHTGLDFAEEAIGAIPTAGPALKRAAQAANAPLRAKLKAVERETFEPLDAAAGRLAGVAGALGRAGVSVAEADMKVGADLLIAQEQRAYENRKKAAQAVYGNGHVMDSFTHAASPH